MPKSLKLILKLAATLALFALIFAMVDWHEALRAFRSADWLWTLSAILVIASSVAISAWRWQRLVKLVASSLRLPAALKAYWIGFFCSNFLPASIAGDAVRAVVTRKHGGTAQMAVIILIERLSGLFVLLWIAALALWLTSGQDFLPIPHLAASAGFVFLAVCIPIGCWLAHIVFNRLSGQHDIIGKLAKITMAIRNVEGLRGEMAVTLVLSIIFYGTLVLSQFAQLKAVGAEVPVTAVMIAVPLIALISAIPISFNGLGVAEGFFVLIYNQSGVDPEHALAAALLRRITIMVVACLGGVFMLLGKNG